MTLALKRIASILGVAATVGLMSLGPFGSPAAASRTPNYWRFVNSS